ncbi:MAG: acetyl-CoA carboxylase biotin carboxyl carrier protein subunit [Acidobacteria bacterium]|nr:acetyl-CoA carboxylase biotin carboxyl carrier protein subunit [Acidobacteriota bacterium]
MSRDVRNIEAGTDVVIVDGRVIRVTHAGAEVLVNGKAATLDLTDPRDRKRGASGGAAGGQRNIKAAMPGKVVKILVASGDTVEAGQGLLILEAMKMQNEVRAPGAGTVSAVRVREADTVAAGAVLVTLD